MLAIWRCRREARRCSLLLREKVNVLRHFIISQDGGRARHNEMCRERPRSYNVRSCVITRIPPYCVVVTLFLCPMCGSHFIIGVSVEGRTQYPQGSVLPAVSSSHRGSLSMAPVGEGGLLFSEVRREGPRICAPSHYDS